VAAASPGIRHAALESLAQNLIEALRPLWPAAWIAALTGLEPSGNGRPAMADLLLDRDMDPVLGQVAFGAM
jgi:hypothetical protein